MSTKKPVRTLVEILETRQLLTAYVGGSTTAYATIQAAVDAAPTGGSVRVTAGTYAETVSVYKRLTITGAQAGVDARTSARGAGESVVTGGLSGGTRTAGFYVAASDVKIDGFTVQDNTNTGTYGAGIVIAPNKAGTKIVNNIVQNNVSGLFLANNSSTNPAVIQYNLFRTNNQNGENGGRAIYTDQGISGGTLTNVTIDSNAFIGNRGGWYTTGLEAAVAFESGKPGSQTNLRLTNNFFDGNGKSTLFFNSDNVTITGNTVTGALDWYSGSLRFEGNNHNVKIQSNTIYANTGVGVAVDSKGVPGDSSGFVVTNNNIYGNSTQPQDKLGVVVDGDAYVGTFDARNNYWGSPTGPSGDGPGSGDAIYGIAYDIPTGSYVVSKGGAELFSPWKTTAIGPSATPTNLTAAKSSTAVTLTWKDNAADETGYAVERKTSGGVWGQIATLGAGATTYADAAGVSGTFVYRVRTTGAVASAYSNEAVPTTAPTPPTPIVYTAPSGLKAVANTSGAAQVSLTWADNASGETGYKIERSTNGSTFTQIALLAANAKAYIDTAVKPATTYTYRVRAAFTSTNSGYSNTVAAKTAAAGPVYLSDLQWTSMVNGWGSAERDRSNGGQATGDGGVLTLNGATFTKGIGVHAASTLTYALNGKYATFASSIGIDDAEGSKGKVAFKVYGDNKLLYDSGLMTGSSATKAFNVAVRGVTTLKLVVTDGGDGVDYDHADWAGAKLTLA